MLRTATFDIKVDGQVVGKIAPDSYFFIDRPPGTYTLKVEPPWDWVYFETDVKVAAGGTYHYAINVKPVAVPITGGGAVGIVAMAHPQIGTPMQPKERELDLRYLQAQCARCHHRRRRDGKTGRRAVKCPQSARERQPELSQSL